MNKPKKKITKNMTRLQTKLLNILVANCLHLEIKIAILLGNR